MIVMCYAMGLVSCDCITHLSGEFVDVECIAQFFLEGCAVGEDSLGGAVVVDREGLVCSSELFYEAFGADGAVDRGQDQVVTHRQPGSSAGRWRRDDCVQNPHQFEFPRQAPEEARRTEFLDLDAFKLGWRRGRVGRKYPVDPLECMISWSQVDLFNDARPSFDSGRPDPVEVWVPLLPLGDNAGHATRVIHAACNVKQQMMQQLVRR